MGRRTLRLSRLGAVAVVSLVVVSPIAVGQDSVAQVASAVSAAPQVPAMLHLNLIKRIAADGGEQEVNDTAQWDPQRTALIVCDMWDDHWCRGAAARVVEMAPAMNRVVEQMRERGVLVIHAPSTCTEFYAGSGARRRAQQAPTVKPPVELVTSTRWGTCWSWPDPTRETDLPIDDSDMGCDCAEKCAIREAWTRQIDTIRIDDARDAITDNGQELVNLFAQHQIKHVAIMGVHLNMCVLGRPFGIRQLVKLGPDVVLIRDMTDTMYDHRRAPYVSHFAGTELVVQHVERYWCPTITSDQLVDGQPYRFAAQRD